MWHVSGIFSVFKNKSAGKGFVWGGNSQKLNYFNVTKKRVLIHFPRKKNNKKTPAHATRQIYLPIDWNHHLDQIFSVE